MLETVTSIRSASFAVALVWTLASPTNTGAQISDPEADRAQAIDEAIMREAYTDKDLIQEFGAFVDPEEAGEKLYVCGARLTAVNTKELYIKSLEEGLGSVGGWLRTAQILAGKAQEKYRKTLDVWAEKKGPEATHYFDTTVKAERDAWQEAAAAVTKAEKALESERKDFRSRIEEEWNEIRSIFKIEGIEFADVSRASLGDLKAKLKDRCERMWLWKKRGAEVIGRPEKQHPPFQPPDETPEGPPPDKVGPADAAEDKAPDPLVAAAEGAIADCDFKKVRSTIEGMAPGPIRDRLAERLEAAVAREQKTKALWQQAREEYRQERKANAIALLEKAKANSECSQYLARIEKALTKLDAEDATARPSANTENEGPPSDEAPQVPQGAILQLSGEVDQGPANAVNAREGDNAPRMELKSGTITLSFIAEETPEGGAAGGRVVITPKMVKLTYTYDYRHAPPQQLVDWMESKCELVATRFVSGSSGEVYPGIVGGYSCEVQRKRNGEGPPKETVTGALRLDQDPTTKAWMLTFVNGPQYALWRLK